MNLAAKTSAYLSTLSMSVPARLALWAGLGLMVFGYMRNQVVLTLVGLVLIMTGTALWLIFRPKGGGWRALIGLRTPRAGQERPGKQQGRNNKVGSALGKFSERRKMINEAVNNAQNDPLFQARRPGKGQKGSDKQK